MPRRDEDSSHRATLLLRPLSALREAIGGMQAALECAPLPSTVAPARHDV
jgi:hypothetical protein